MPKNEKAVFAVLGIAGVLAMFFGFFRINYNIKKPFELRPLTNQENIVEGDDLFTLQTKDTDKDGLSDYDEVYIYNTSPYIKDSDSDGKFDALEVEQGTDPNCPEGKICQNNTTEEGDEVGFDLPNSSTEGFESGDALDISEFDLTSFGPEEIKQMLKASGMTEEMISSLSEADLMQIYTKALEQAQTE